VFYTPAQFLHLQPNAHALRLRLFSNMSHLKFFSTEIARALFAAVAAATLLLSACANNTTSPAADAKPAELRLDYATYNLSSLVLKKQGWLEQDLEKDGVKVTWILSAGSNKANELVNSNSSDFGSTAGAAALLARTNGVPLKTVYVYSRPEWTALVAKTNSPVKAVSDLKGKKVAVTRGTDPFFFLLRSLKDAGLSQSDVEIVNLQHADGRQALLRGDVDAWSGLDPHMAAAELKDDAAIFHRNIDFNTFGTLNVREDFASKYPGYVKRVLKNYERAREWIIANPEEAAKILAESGKIDLEIARKQLSERTVLNAEVGVPGAKLQSALQAVVPILVDEKLVGSDKNPANALDELIDASFATDLAATSPK
jgi:sulfonate transport system substrate-binding protein